MLPEYDEQIGDALPNVLHEPKPIDVLPGPGVMMKPVPSDLYGPGGDDIFAAEDSAPCRAGASPTASSAAPDRTPWTTSPRSTGSPSTSCRAWGSTEPDRPGPEPSREPRDHDAPVGIENVRGSQIKDFLHGDGGADPIQTGLGRDHVDARGRDDTVPGGGGDD